MSSRPTLPGGACALFGQLGLGAPLPHSVSSAKEGRNRNWRGRTELGHAFFVKQIRGGDTEDAHARFRRTLGAERTLGHGSGPSRPRLLGSSVPERLVVFEHLSRSRSGFALAEDGAFTSDIAEACGTSVGSLHALDPAAHVLTPERSQGLLDRAAVPVRTLLTMSGAEIEAIRLLQQDAPLRSALRDLAVASSSAPVAVTHGDLRLDQFLVDESGVHLCDWEEAAQGDPAADVGAYAGDWVHRAILTMDLLTASDHGVPSRSDVRCAARAAVRSIRPLVSGFWAAYGWSNPRCDTDLARRATAYAGRHLCDRLLAASAVRGLLTAADRAAAGLGRSLLLDPAAWVDTIGLAEV